MERKRLIFYVFVGWLGVFLSSSDRIWSSLCLSVSHPVNSNSHFQMHEIRALRLWNQFNGLLLFIVWRSLNFIFMFMYLRLRWEKCLIANSCSKEPNAQNKTHYIEKIWITGAQSKARGQNGTSATPVGVELEISDDECDKNRLNYKANPIINETTACNANGRLNNPSEYYNS